jgi:hypothetical protein
MLCSPPQNQLQILDIAIANSSTLLVVSVIQCRHTRSPGTRYFCLKNTCKHLDRGSEVHFFLSRTGSGLAAGATPNQTTSILCRSRHTPNSRAMSGAPDHDSFLPFAFSLSAFAKARFRIPTCMFLFMPASQSLYTPNTEMIAAIISPWLQYGLPL